MANPGSRLNGSNVLCSSDTDFWTCVNGPFIGCCSHDPCHDGYCHDLTEEALYHMPFKHVDRRAPQSNTVITTITYTLIHVSQPTSFVAGAASKAPALVSVLGYAPNSARRPTTSLKPGVAPISSSTSNTSPSSSSTSSVNPTAAPVPGAKKSARAIAGIALGVIFAALIALVLLYLCISQKKKRTRGSAFATKRKKNRKRRESDGKRNGNDGDSFKVDDSPITPGGAKLEAQRGRMLSEDRATGYRALGMTAQNGGAAVNDRDIPNLTIPTPGARITEHGQEHDAANLGTRTGVFGFGLVHPAYRNSGNNAGFEEIANGGPQQHFHTETVFSQLNHGARTSWTPGADVIRISESRSTVERACSNTTAGGSGDDLLMKPSFDEVTSGWASVASPDHTTRRLSDQWPVGIGHAVTSPRGMGVDRDANGTVAMSTENEVTSPVDDGGLTRPVRRNVNVGVDGFRGFDEILGGDGRLKR